MEAAVTDETKVPGPYWVVVTDAECQVQGRNGKIIRRYPLDMEPAADQDCRNLQRGYASEQKRILDAAPDLLEALESLHRICDGVEFESLKLPGGKAAVKKAKSAITKARGND
jgi:hypothetical protein